MLLLAMVAMAALRYTEPSSSRWEVLTAATVAAEAMWCWWSILARPHFLISTDRRIGQQGPVAQGRAVIVMVLMARIWS